MQDNEANKTKDETITDSQKLEDIKALLELPKSARDYLIGYANGITDGIKIIQPV